MFPFRTKVVADPGAQLNFEQLGLLLPARQYAVPFSLAAGIGAVTTVALAYPLPAKFVPVGAMNYTGVVSFQDTVTWAYRVVTPQSVEIALHNNGSGLAVGTFFFSIQGFAA